MNKLVDGKLIPLTKEEIAEREAAAIKHEKRLAEHKLAQEQLTQARKRLIEVNLDTINDINTLASVVRDLLIERRTSGN